MLPLQVEGKLHSVKCSHAEARMMRVAYYGHLSYLEDKSQARCTLEEVAMVDLSTSIIEPLQKKKDGQAAFQSIVL